MSEVLNACERKVGLAYHKEIPLERCEFQRAVDCIEITADEVFDLTAPQRAEIKQLRRKFTLLVHSLDVSIGSVERPPQAYLDKVARVLELTDAPYWSDHLAVSSTHTTSLGQFSPVWYTGDVLEVVAN